MNDKNSNPIGNPRVRCKDPAAPSGNHGKLAIPLPFKDAVGAALRVPPPGKGRQKP